MPASQRVPWLPRLPRVSTYLMDNGQLVMLFVRKKCRCWRRLGDPAELAAEAGWSASHASGRGDEVLAAAVGETEARASALDLENARLRLALVTCHTCRHFVSLLHGSRC